MSFPPVNNNNVLTSGLASGQPPGGLMPWNEWSSRNQPERDQVAECDAAYQNAVNRLHDAPWRTDEFRSSRQALWEAQARLRKLKERADVGSRKVDWERLDQTLDYYRENAAKAAMKLEFPEHTVARYLDLQRSKRAAETTLRSLRLRWILSWASIACNGAVVGDLHEDVRGMLRAQSGSWSIFLHVSRELAIAIPLGLVEILRRLVSKALSIVARRNTR